ncbi:MAG: transposase, partial [Pirellulaceae bacterium]
MADEHVLRDLMGCRTSATGEHEWCCAHVHIHALVPAGGLTYAEPRLWVPFPRSARFLSEEMLASTFRNRFLAALEEMHASGALALTASWQCLAAHEAFDRWLAPLRHINWQVRHRPVWRPEGVETGTPSEKVVSYLARYANRVVIANDRLIKIEGGEVYFSYKDYRDNNRRKVHHLPGVAFLSQFLQHILPRGLHNKRRYGFWG